MSTVEFRTLDDGHWVTNDDGQHIFIRGGRVYASREAITEAAKLHSVRAGTTLGDAVIAKAKSEGVHPDHLRAAVDAVHQRHRDETGELNAALTHARQLTGLNSRRISQWEESGKDHSSYPHLDVKARDLAAEHPVLGLHAYSDEGSDEGDNAARLWEMLARPAAETLPRHAPEVLDRAAELVHQANRGQALRSKPVRPAASPRWDTRAQSRIQDVPFSGRPAFPPRRQSKIQTIHDLTASHPGVCGPSASLGGRTAEFRCLQDLHDRAVAGGAVCGSTHDHT